MAEYVFMLYMHFMGQEGRAGWVLNLHRAPPLCVRQLMKCQESKRLKRDNQRVCNLGRLGWQIVEIEKRDWRRLVHHRGWCWAANWSFCEVARNPPPIAMDHHSKKLSWTTLTWYLDEPFRWSKNFWANKSSHQSAQRYVCRLIGMRSQGQIKASQESILESEVASLARKFVTHKWIMYM